MHRLYKIRMFKGKEGGVYLYHSGFVFREKMKAYLEVYESCG